MKYLLILLLIVFCINKLQADEITFLDIQTQISSAGDAIVIQSTDSNGHNIYAMIDTGKKYVTSYSKIINFLREKNITTLEWILISHNHSDHVNGFSYIVRNYNLKVKNVYLKEYKGLDTYYTKNSYIRSVQQLKAIQRNNYNDFINTANSINAGINFITKYKNTELKLGNYLFHLLNVEEVFSDFEDECNSTEACNENSNSIIAVGENRDKYYYLSGDIDTYPITFLYSQNTKLINAYKKNTVDKWVIKALNLFKINHFDVVKASHHGVLYNNIQQVFIEAKPGICVVSGTEKDKVDAIELISRVKNGNSTAQIYFTGSGTVTISQDQYGNIKATQGTDEHYEVSKDDIDHDTRIQWFYNIESRKCLYAPTSLNSKVYLEDCSNDYRAQWIVSPGRKGCFPSRANINWCITFDDNEEIFVLKECDQCDPEYIMKYEDNMITIPSTLECLDTERETDGELNIVMKTCSNLSKGQKWSIWNLVPPILEERWVNIKNTNKCLFSPEEHSSVPIIKDCDDSDASKWLVAPRYRSYIRSLAYPDRCLHVKDIEEGTVIMGECDSRAYINNFDRTSTKDAITPLLNMDKCLDLFKSYDKDENRVNFNTCNENIEEQHWEFSRSNPSQYFKRY